MRNLPFNTHASAWDPHTLARDPNWLVTLEPAELEELRACIGQILDTAKPLEALTREDFSMPRLARRLQSWRSQLLHGLGFLQVRGFEPEINGRAYDACAFWAMGLHLGDRFVSQNKHGHLLGHVTDLGQSRTNVSQRGPYSSERIPFHVDACDIVGLMCLSPPKSGGESSVVSSGHLYNVMRERRPDLAANLMQPVYRDRRDEIPRGKVPWYAIPVFSWYAGLLSANIEPTYIASVARHFDGVNPHSEQLLEALEYAQTLSQELHFDIEFQPGDFQFVHNHTTFHSRKAFVDGDGPARHRHLLRLWVQADDGRPLPDAFYGRQGDRASITRPGGIFASHTQPNVPLWSAMEEPRA